jgi:hypothetical protein
MKQLHYVDGPDGVESISINGVQLEGEENQFQSTSEQISGLPVSDLPPDAIIEIVERKSDGTSVGETIGYSIVALKKLGWIRIDFRVEEFPKYWCGTIGLDRWAEALTEMVRRLGSSSFPGLVLEEASNDDLCIVSFSYTVNAVTTDEALKTAESIRRKIFDAFDVIDAKVDAVIVEEINKLS